MLTMPNFFVMAWSVNSRHFCLWIIRWPSPSFFCSPTAFNISSARSLELSKFNCPSGCRGRLVVVVVLRGYMDALFGHQQRSGRSLASMAHVIRGAGRQTRSCNLFRGYCVARPSFPADVSTRTSTGSSVHGHARRDRVCSYHEALL